jgi:hypothetical protein
MKLRSLLIALFTLIALAAPAQNQPSSDQRIKQLEDKVTALEGRLKELEASMLRIRSSPVSWDDAVQKFESVRQSSSSPVSWNDQVRKFEAIRQANQK